MKRKLFLLTLGIAFTMLVAQLNRVDVLAVTQDELIQMWEEEDRKNGFNPEDCNTTGGTANDAGGEALTQKMEEINRNKELSNSQPTAAPNPKVEKQSEEVKKEEPVIKECEHKYVTTTTKEPTCTEKGEATYKCSKCGDTYTETLEPLGHTVGEWEITKEPTCIEKGEKVQKCTVCGEIINTEELEPLGHTVGEWEVSKKATMISTGEKVQKCKTCDEILNREEIPINYTNWYIIGGVLIAVLFVVIATIVVKKKRK